MPVMGLAKGRVSERCCSEVRPATHCRTVTNPTASFRSSFYPAIHSPGSRTPIPRGLRTCGCETWNIFIENGHAFPIIADIIRKHHSPLIAGM